MATSPEEVRAALTVVTAASISEVRQVAAAAGTPQETRAALFAAVPLIVSEYMDGASALALDWYDELRLDAAPTTTYTPSPVQLVTDDYVAAVIAGSTVALRDAPDDLAPDVTETSLQLLAGGVQKIVAGGFRDTMTTNALQDPAAVGWRRYARDDACKFCLMAAAKGAVYTRETARFAPHNDCHCLAGPGFDPNAPKASAVQYMASKRTRTPEQRAALRDYLNLHFPHAHG